MIKFLKHYFVPHSSNDHRARILHPSFLSFFIVVLLSLLIVAPHIKQAYPAVLGVSTNISINELVDYTNQKRSENGLPSLSLSSQLSSAASGKAMDMFTNNYWAHVSPSGTTPWFFIRNAGYNYVYAGENLARGFDNASDIVNAWMASPSHRENILSGNYSEVGFAVQDGSLTGSDTILVVQMFGSQNSTNVAQGGVSDDVQASVVETEITPVPTGVPVASAPESTNAQGVAALTSQPLVDSSLATRNISLFIMMLLIVVLAVELVVIDRKKIERIVSHNLDHIIFLVIIVIAAIIIGGGSVL